MLSYSRVHFFLFFFFSSRRRHTRCSRDWSSDVCSSDLEGGRALVLEQAGNLVDDVTIAAVGHLLHERLAQDRKSTRLNSSHGYISYAVFCLKKKKKIYPLLLAKKTNKILMNRYH